MDNYNFENPFNKNIWLAERREDIRFYFKSRELVCQRIPELPLWSMSPFTSIWMVKGVGMPGFTGWYVIAGDHPTDIVGLGSFNGPADILKHFSAKWAALSLDLIAGKPVSDFRIPADADLERYGRVIADRADKLWKVVQQLG